ncbi:hypothetical protein C8Q74DRAFT_1276469 [Fomes fomentarius]|nr:hypothetical protein C8Q74DRAFT_1276469 [Fomes fomentarius]
MRIQGIYLLFPLTLDVRASLSVTPSSSAGDLMIRHASKIPSAGTLQTILQAHCGAEFELLANSGELPSTRGEGCSTPGHKSDIPLRFFLPLYCTAWLGKSSTGRYLQPRRVRANAQHRSIARHRPAVRAYATDSEPQSPKWLHPHSPSLQ